MSRNRSACRAAVIAALLAGTAAGDLRAQSSSNYTLAPGVLGSIGETSSSSSVRWFGESGTSLAQGRSSSAGADAIGGFIGPATSPRANVSFATAANTFTMISFPLRPGDGSPTAVLDELGAYDNRVWRFGRWNPATAAYQEVGGGLPNIEPGRGYWLITQNARTGLVATGLPVSDEQEQGNFGLVSGPASAAAWNQMGNPFLFGIDVRDVLVTDGVTTKQVNDPTNAWTEQSLKIWNSGTSAYVNATALGAGQGFWVRRLAGAGTISLRFRRNPLPPVAPQPLPPAGASQDEAALVKDGGVTSAATSPGVYWAYSLTLRQGARSAEPLILGAADVPAGEWNPMALSGAPAPPGMRMLSLTAAQSGWGSFAGDYTRVYQPVAETMAWDVDLRGSDGPGEVTLDVEASGVPDGMRLVLTDARTGDAHALSVGSSLTLPAYAGGRRYRVVATGGSATDAGQPKREGFHLAYPNPSRAGVGLTFALARAGDAVVEVFDLQGRLVRTIARRGLTPGEHVLVWDGSDTSGRRVGSGVYLARWQTPTARGTTRLVRMN